MAGAPESVAEEATPIIMNGLADALLGTLRLAFVVVRLNDPNGGPVIEIIQAGTPTEGATDLCLASARLDLRGEIGIVVAGCRRLEFPTEMDTLVLEMAAKQAGTALQQIQQLTAQHRRAEQALRESQRESIPILDNIPGLAAILTPEGEVDNVNNELIEYCGQPLEAMKQWGTNGTVHAEDLPQVGRVFGQAVMSGEPYDFEARIRRFDGAYRWLQVRGLPLRGRRDNIVRWYVLLTDIDDRKQAEGSLRKSEHEFRLLVDTIPALVWRGTPDGDLDYLNQKAVEYLGYTAQSLAGGRWLELVHPDHRETTVQRWMQSAATGSPYDDIYQLRRADGQYRWIRSVGQPLRDADGRIVHWYGLVIDIENRKRAEDELRRSEAFLAQAQRLTLTGSLWWDVSTGVVTWSDETFRVMDVPRTVTPTLELALSRVHPDDLAFVKALVDRSASDGANLDCEPRLLMRDGTIKHVHVVLQNAGRHAGRPQFVGAVTDITERKRAEAVGRAAQEALSKAGAELAQVSRITTLNALTASIAHEVNQPLSGIITNAGTCVRLLNAVPPDIDGARETAKRTIRDGNRAADVIARLRALFSKRELTREPLNLTDAAREVIALSSNDLLRNRIVLRSELADDLPLVTGDRIQLQQVIFNLLRNASDAMVDVHDRPRQLLIRTERESGHYIRFSVRDAGVGLPAQSTGALFDAFYTTKSGGMGIGLFVSRSIVENHHGRLWAEPNEGPGATFSFSVPMAE